MSYHNTLDNLVNKDYDELLSFGKIALGKIYSACCEADSENKGMLLMTSIILSAIAADGKLTSAERRFLMDLFELTGEQTDSFIGMYDNRMAELTHRFADTLSPQLKSDVVLLVSTVAACDETISREETAFIRKLID